MTSEAVLEILTVFEAAYRTRYQAKHVLAWEGFLSDVDDGDGKRAAQELVRRLPKPPALSEFLSAAADVRAERERTDSVARAKLPSGDRRSLTPSQAGTLLKAMWAECLRMKDQGVSVDERARLLTAMANDRLREAGGHV